MKAKVKFDAKKITKAARKGSLDSLKDAGKYIYGIARKSIKRTSEPAPPGHQPHTRKGQLPRAVRFAVEKQYLGVVIGPTNTGIGKIGHTHEFGGTEPPKKYKKPNWKVVVGGHGPIRRIGGKQKLLVVRLNTPRQVSVAENLIETLPPSEGGPPSKKKRKYPPRPFMGPALKIALPYLPKMWRNSVRAQ